MSQGSHLQRLFTIEQLSALDGLGQFFLENECRAMRLPHAFFGNARRVLLEDYHAWQREQVDGFMRQTHHVPLQEQVQRLDLARLEERFPVRRAFG